MNSQTHMIDISEKKTTLREAVVEGKIILEPAVIMAIKKKEIPKGEVLTAAELAGILAAKKTAELIPLCHPLSAEYINIEFAFTASTLKIKTTVKGSAKTGMEMEALVATSIAALTIYDMCKPLDKHIVVSEIKLLNKTGGKSEIKEK